MVKSGRDWDLDWYIKKVLNTENKNKAQFFYTA